MKLCIIGNSHVGALRTAWTSGLSDDFPESDRREVLWTSLDDAIARADDPGVAEVLTTFRERFA